MTGIIFLNSIFFLLFALSIYRTHHPTHIYLVLRLSKVKEGEACELLIKAAISLTCVR